MSEQEITALDLERNRVALITLPEDVDEIDRSQIKEPIENSQDYLKIIRNAIHVKNFLGHGEQEGLTGFDLAELPDGTKVLIR